MAQRGRPRHRKEAHSASVAVLCIFAVLVTGFTVYRLGWSQPPPEQTPGRPVAKPVRSLPPLRFRPAPSVSRVLEKGGTAPAPTPKAVRAAVAGPLRARVLGSHVGLVVRDSTRDRELLSFRGGDRFVPASTTKLLTATAALDALDPQSRFSTSVVSTQGSRRIVLVGGGDPLLARRPAPSAEDAAAYPGQATLRRLSTLTARALRERGVASVRLGLDADLFRGPSVSPRWEPGYVRDNVVSPITALWVDEGRAGTSSRRSPDPVLAAGVAFARDLRRHGITVRGQPQETSAPRGAPTLATVSSPPVAAIVEHVLAVSDNEAAEVLLRHVALAAGRTPSFTGGVVAVRRILSRRGLDMSGVVIHDGSGLSRDNRLPLATLVNLLDLAEETPRLRPVVADLPVAGFSGSLGYRFAASDTSPGRGLVRAKTGTLSQVHLLAGSALVAGGTVLTFALAADRVRAADTLAARDAMDRVASALATCGCS